MEKLPDLEASNNYLAKIKDLAVPTADFEEVFEIVSKNPGIAFIALDPSESSIQLFHHCHVFGGSWSSPTKSFVGILGADESARPVQIVTKSVKTAKTKTIAFDEIVFDELAIKNLEDPKHKKVEIQVRNIMPIPHILTKAYLSLEKVDPHSVAQAFYVAMKEFDTKSKNCDLDTNFESDLVDEDTLQGIENSDGQITGEASENEGKEDKDSSVPASETCLASFVHVLQFCHLCFSKKVRPIIFSVNLSPEVNRWFESLVSSLLRPRSSRQKRQNSDTFLESDSEDSESSPDQKVSRKDKIFINTMLKLHDSMDKSYREKSDKEPGFSRLERYRKNLILNASALPPFTAAATTPTDFYTTFLAKKSQFKAKFTSSSQRKSHLILALHLSIVFGIVSIFGSSQIHLQASAFSSALRLNHLTPVKLRKNDF
jgi:hypothetical protein